MCADQIGGDTISVGSSRQSPQTAFQPLRIHSRAILSRKSVLWAPAHMLTPYHCAFS